MSAKAGLVHTEDSRPRPAGYGAALKDHFTGAQKRRPASALQAYRENWPFTATHFAASNEGEKQVVLT